MCKCTNGLRTDLSTSESPVYCQECRAGLALEIARLDARIAAYDAALVPLAGHDLKPWQERQEEQLWNARQHLVRERARLAGNLERRNRGLHLAAAGAVSPNGGPGCYHVASASGNGTYLVDTDAHTCTCPDARRGGTCKHTWAAIAYQEGERVARAICNREGLTPGELEDRILNDLARGVPSETVADKLTVVLQAARGLAN